MGGRFGQRGLRRILGSVKISGVGNLVRNSAIVTLADGINAAIPFFLLFFLTRVLSVGDYAILSSVTILLQVISMLTGFSINAGFRVKYFENSGEALQRYWNSAILWIIAISIILFLTLRFGFPDVLESALIPRNWLWAIFLLAFFQVIIKSFLVLWLCQNKPVHFGVFKVSQTAINVGMTVLLIAGYGYGWEGRFLGIFVSAGLFATFCAVMLWGVERWYRGGASMSDVKEIIKFGVPLIPHQLATWVRFGLDRWLITWLVGAGEMGVYAAGFQLGMIMGIIVAAMNQAFAPFILRQLSANPDLKEKEKLVKLTYAIIVGITGLAFFMIVTLHFATPLILGPDFRGATKFVPWIVAGFAFNGMYLMFVHYIMFVKRTYLLSVATVSASIIHVLVAVVLIQKFGAIGAAYAMTVSMFASLVFVWIASMRVYDMPWMSTGRQLIVSRFQKPQKDDEE